MLRLPIHWEIPNTCLVFGEKVESFSKLTLNKEWEVTYMQNSNSFEQNTVTISRKNTSDELLISGSLSYSQNGQGLIPREFSRIMLKESSTITIEFKNLHVTQQGTFGLGFNFIPTIRKLSGMLYIISTSKNAVDDLASDECKNCKSLEKLSNDLERLLVSQTPVFPDVNLKCGDVLIPTHKNILSARSAVFAAMFANEMKENRKNQVDITDLDESVVRSLLTFMYTGKTNLTVALASDLLFAADKYQVDDLKRVCCDFLKKNVSPENMLRIYVLADLHDEDLKSFIEDYICNTCDDFSAFETTEEWKTFRKEKPNLALDIAISLVKSRDHKLKGTQGS